MKKFKLYILLCAAVVVWSLIAFKIYSRLSDSPSRITTKQLVSAEYTQKEKLVLNLNYPDPFFKRSADKPKVPVYKKPEKHSTPVQTEPDILIDWSKIEYMGMVTNASKNVPIATLKVAGAEYFVKEGEVVDIFLVESIFQDSIQLSYKQKSKYIRRN